MEDERLKFFEDLLNERLNSLLVAAGSNIGDLTSEREQAADTIDIAAMESNRDFKLRLADRERRLVKKLRQAIRRIQDGEYGECVACGEDISERRLMARPVATHCIDCKTEAESLERRHQRNW
jgi:DnaK suppressor protein